MTGPRFALYKKKRKKKRRILLHHNFALSKVGEVGGVTWYRFPSRKVNSGVGVDRDERNTGVSLSFIQGPQYLDRLHIPLLEIQIKS